MIKFFFNTLLALSFLENVYPTEGLPLYYWQQGKLTNFGDYLSLKLVERILQEPVRVCKKVPCKEKKLIAIGSVFSWASDQDTVWGSGIKKHTVENMQYRFSTLDIRAVRGPLTRQFLWEHFRIEAPEIYGDPALLIPYFFPEFKKKEDPYYDYIIIPHFSEEHLFPKDEFDNVVYTTEEWEEVMDKILDSKFVISSSLHGVIVAEAFGIPARLLRITDNQPLFKYQDYYAGTNRPHFSYATSVGEALRMGGEPPYECDLEKLYRAFPFEFWPHISFKHPNFNETVN